MIDLKYTISKFDIAKKVVTVTFDDSSWAEIRLSNPLPSTVEELETIIKQFAAPIEAIEAQTNPNVDISYIEALIGQERTTTRLQLIPPVSESQTDELDPEVEASMRIQENLLFQKKVGDILVSLGVIETNPTIIPAEII